MDSRKQNLDGTIRITLTNGDGYPRIGPRLGDEPGEHVTVFDVADISWSAFGNVQLLTDDDFEMGDDPDGDGQIPALKVWQGE